MARFVATGGITTKNARSYLDPGAAAISLGSAFADSPGEEIPTLVTNTHDVREPLLSAGWPLRSGTPLVMEGPR